MRKYKLIDNFAKTEQIVSEKDLRDLYDTLMEEIIYNWRDCGDEKIMKDLEKEKEEVYTVAMKQVIMNIEDIDEYYKIEKLGKKGDELV